MSLLSVIIINYNTFELTCNCIKSIYEYTKRIPFEIILIDNSSTECAPQAFLTLFPDVKLICSKVNTGFAGGNNLGIQNSKGDIILLLNSDTELIEDSLSYCYEYINSVNYPLALTCKLIYPDHTIQHQCGRFPAILLNLVELFRIHKLLNKQKRARLLLSSYFNHEEMIEPDWIWGTFFMFNRAILSQLKEQKLDDRFFMYCEDIKWCFDLKKLNIKIVYLPDTKIVHHVGSSSGSEVRMNNISKNELLFVRLTKGRIYQWVYTLVRSANLLSTGTIPGKKAALGLLKNINN